jgi:hypothetical protein
MMKWRPAPLAWVAVAVLTFIFWANPLRFHPQMIEPSYDDTSEELVIGRMARSAADGLFSKNADLGTNYDPAHPSVQGRDSYEAQKRFYENPDLIRSMNLSWGVYPSHFDLQGIFFSVLDRLNPLPRKYRIGFYHGLAALFAAGMLVWIADMLRRRFGFAASVGFLVPVALEPLFTALSPNLYWLVGLWFLPMAIAMRLAEQETPRRRAAVIALAFLAFVAKFLCGYEFTSTVILAAAVGCLLDVSEGAERLRRVLRDATAIVSVGVAGFLVAALAHAMRQGGFAVIVEKAANRMTGDADSFQEELVLGKFATIASVLSNYLGGNYITLIKSFGVVLTLLAVTAVAALLDGKFNWYLGPDRRRLQILALGFLASIAAPLSWFVLGKAHSFAHLHIDLVMWYLPTVPLGCAMAALALSQTIEHRALWRIDAARSLVAAAIPVLVLGAVLTVYFVDRGIQTRGTWVISAHADASPLFSDSDLGVDFRMNDQWFLVQYDCRRADAGETFLVRAMEGDATANYDFRLADRQVFARKGICLAAQAKADRRFKTIRFGQMSGRQTIWEREQKIAFPDRFTPQPLTDQDWDRGFSRAPGAALLVSDRDFVGLFIRPGDLLRFSPSEQCRITGISRAGRSRVIAFDGSPVRLPDSGTPVIGIIRE